MYFFKSIFIVALIGIHVLRAEESVPESSEEVKEISINNEAPNEEMKASEPPMDSSTESLETSSSDETTETIAILFEEMEPESQSSSESTDAQTSTESNELITSEYNGLDEKESESSFSCYGRSFGQYADVSKECRVFHLCYPFFNSSSDELLYQRITFLCDDESVFDQKRFICVDNSTIEHKCTDSEALYVTSNQEYLIRVFAQNVSPINEVKGKSEEEEETKTNTSPANPGWFHWLYNH